MLRRIVLRVATLGAVLALWWVVTATHLWSDVILPSPGRVWAAFVESVTTDRPVGVDGRRSGVVDDPLVAVR
jgi:ABC-type nitrate/sulfonate/bicarbonate transport system permease component